LKIKKSIFKVFTKKNFLSFNFNDLLYFKTDIFNHNATVVVNDNNLKILKYDFIRGLHYSDNSNKFIALIQQLQKIHEYNYVHGDVRLANIIFKKTSYATLIDFDFCGINLKDKYRKGFFFIFLINMQVCIYLL
jgi:serine/threonine protein kinase